MTKAHRSSSLGAFADLGLWKPVKVDRGEVERRRRARDQNSPVCQTIAHAAPRPGVEREPSHKALPDEATSAAALGMTYIHIPVDFSNPTDEDFARFCSVMAELKGVPVHVHCIANYRVSAFFYRYRRDRLGMAENLARADMEEVWRPEGVWAAFTSR